MRPALQVAVGAGPMHLLVGGNALCGVTPNARDVYPDGAGLRQWNDGPLDRCSACEGVLSRRIGRRAAA